MASSAESKPTTLLRVKRKRSVDPANALIVNAHCAKQKRIDTDIHSKEYSKCYFSYAGTVSDGKIEKGSDIFHKLQPKDYHKQEHIVEKIKSEQRKLKKESDKSLRYKVLSEVRQMNENESNETSIADEIQRLYKVFDVIANEEKKETNKEEPKEGDILCNTVKMFRENLNISEGICPASEYVYDIYITSDAMVNEILNVEECSEDMLVYETSDDLNEFYDDEDDENDEDNWRNDYPEEEDCDSDKYNTSSDEVDPYTANYNSDNYFDIVNDYDTDNE